MNHIYIEGIKHEYINLNELILNKYYWFSYKKNFLPIIKNITNDVGWGCMIRTSQMMLAKSLTNLYPNKNWLEYFLDKKENIFSIHNICRYKKKINKNITEWVGPHSVSYLLKFVLEDSILNNLLDIVICENGIISNIGYKKPSILLIPLLIGNKTVSKKYMPYIFNLFKNKQFIGIMGGKDQSAYFIYGIDNKYNLYYLDPHYTQDYTQKVTYWCNEIKTINFDSLDPNLTLCFTFNNQETLDNIYEIFDETNLLPIKFSTVINNIDISYTKDNEWEILN